MTWNIVLAMPRKRTEPGEKALPLERARAAAKFVFAYREAAGCKQESLANAVGVSQFAISKVESEKGIGASVLVKLADYSGVLINRMLGREGIEIDVALDYLSVDVGQRRAVREAALALKGPRPISSPEWAHWIERYIKEHNPERLDLRPTEAAPAKQKRKGVM